MTTKLLFKFEILFYYLKKNILYIIGGIILGFLIVRFWGNINQFYRKIFDTKDIVGIEGLYTDTSLPSSITHEISYGLTQVNDNGRIGLSPIVQNITPENENLNYIVTLKPNFSWHSGKKLTASDIELKINNVETEVINELQLKIITPTAYAPLTSQLEKPIFKKNLVGLGDYQVDSIVYQDGYIHKLALKSLVKGKKDKTYIFYPSEKDLLNAFKLGEINQAIGLSSKYDFAVWPKVKISPEILSSQKYIAVFINTSKYPIKQFRQGLAYATPKTNEINERCIGPISPNSWAYNPNIKDYQFNSARAKDLFEKYRVDSLNLTVTDRRLLAYAQEIKNSWSEHLDLEVSISIENSIDQDNYDVAIAYAGIPVDPDQYTYWHSTQTNGNITHLNNSRIDKLLEEGRQLFDPIERKQTYLDFQRYLLEESPAIFLSYPTVYNISKTD